MAKNDILWFHFIRANKYWLYTDGGSWAGYCLWFLESSALEPQRRAVAFHPQSPNEKESIFLTSANTPRHADKHWIFIMPCVVLSLPRKSKYMATLTHALGFKQILSKKDTLGMNPYALSPWHKQTHQGNIYQTMMQVCCNFQGLQKKRDICFLWTKLSRTVLSKISPVLVWGKHHRWF